jgi:hypothetical protein
MVSAAGRLLTLGALAVHAASAPALAVTEPLHVGTAKQLFIDRRFIETSRGVTLVVNAPRPTREKLIVADRPWEDYWIGGYTSVIQEGNRLHLWYETEDLRGGRGVAYATSTDGGASWAKPNLGIAEYQGSTANNLVVTKIHGHIVFRNRPDAPASQRYCMFVGTPNQAFTSPDGLRWTPLPKVPFLNMGGQSGLDSQNVIFWDTRLRKYVAYPRVTAPPYKRTVARSVSQTFGEFPVPEIMLHRDESDPPNLDFYTSAAIEYPFAADAYFMFPAAYHHYPDPPAGQYRNDGPLDLQFAASRDGIHWSRPDRRPIIRLGREGDWDSGALYAGYGLSRQGDELSLYYTGYPVTHGRLLPELVQRAGVITRAIYRLDGFMSLDAAPEGGEFTTPPLVFDGDRLELNFDGSAGGWAEVEFLDAAGQPVPGFSRQDAERVTGNSVSRLVRWRGKSDLSRLRGTPIRLRLMLRDARLYAFQFPGGQSTLR